MPGRVSQARREREALANSSRRDDSDQEEDGEVDDLPESRRRKRRKRLSEMNADDLFEEMDPKEKAQVSADYRKMQAEVDDMRANAANVTIRELQQKMRESGVLFQKVRDPNLAIMDAKVITTAADTVLVIARKMRLDTNAFNVDEFLIRTKTILGLDREEQEDMDPSSEEDELVDSQDARRGRRNGARKGRLGDWEKIGWMAAKMYRRVPGIEFMYGPIGTAPRKRVVQNRARRAQIEPETRTQNIVAQPGAKGPKDDLMTHVKKVHKCLRRVDPEGGGFNFFRLVVNPADFGQTVENCFFVSFLLKDGLAGIRVADDGELLVYARLPTDEEGNEIDVPKNQAVMELTVDVWEEAIRIYDIQDSIIEDRQPPQNATLGRDKWYA